MKVTIYELLGMIKDGKAPKTIKSEGHYYEYNELEEDYYEGMGYDYEYLLANTSVKGLDNEIEIIEYTLKEKKKKTLEEEFEEYNKNKIPEKIEYVTDENGEFSINGFTFDYEQKMQIIDTLNQVIDYLKSKGDE